MRLKLIIPVNVECFKRIRFGIKYLYKKNRKDYIHHVINNLDYNTGKYIFTPMTTALLGALSSFYGIRLPYIMHVFTRNINTDFFLLYNNMF